jgi:hypothetical protein
MNLVAVDHGRHGSTIFGRELRIVLQVEEQFAHPVVRHCRFLAASGITSFASGDR